MKTASSAVNQEKQETKDAVERPPPPKPRPRPGSFNTGGPRHSRRLPPPPSSQRRNSAAADLISFGSPENSPTTDNSPSPAWVEFNKVTKSTTSTFSVQTSTAITTTTSTIPSQTLFAINPNTTFPFMGNEINHTRPNYIDTSFMPLTFPLRDSSALDCSVGVQAIQSAEQIASPMDVLNVVKKRDNNNLIDLSLSDSQGTSQRGSVLENFDPLFSNTRDEKQEVKADPVVTAENKGMYSVLTCVFVCFEKL